MKGGGRLRNGQWVLCCGLMFPWIACLLGLLPNRGIFSSCWNVIAEQGKEVIYLLPRDSGTTYLNIMVYLIAEYCEHFETASLRSNVCRL